MYKQSRVICAGLNDVESLDSPNSVDLLLTVVSIFLDLDGQKKHFFIINVIFFKAKQV